MSDMRISGIMSGFDTEQMVTDLMDAESLKLEKLYKEQQMIEWEQEEYRSVINEVNDFSDTYFDLLSSETSLRAQSSFSHFAYSVTSNGVSTSAVSVTASTSIEAFNHTINSIDSIATKDTWTGATAELTGIKSSGFDLAALKTALGTDDFEMVLSIDGNSKTLTIDNASIGAATTDAELVTLINNEIMDEFGVDYSNVVSATTDGEIYFQSASNEITVLEYTGNSATMTGMGLTSGEKGSDYSSKTVADLFPSLTQADLDALTFNGVSDFGITTSDTIETMTEKINSSDAGVTLKFDSLQDKFVLQANETGSVNDIDFSGTETINFLSALNITDDGTTALGDHAAGENAVLTLNGVEIVKSSNEFSYQGISIEVNDVSADPIEIGVSKDTDKIIENIEGFVEQYNELIGMIHDKLDEVRNYDYEPLTDEEKEALSDEEVEKLEDAAKAGLLSSSSELETMVSRMRRALYESVEGAGITLKEIGITTSSYYKDNGKLTIDKDKLEEALEDNYEEVIKLFTTESDKAYLDSDNKTERYNENGLANRLYDITRDYTRTTRDSNGKKGLLIEKAGIENDPSSFKNSLTSYMDDYDDRIDDLLDYLDDKEDYYWSMFTRMESALAEMESQASSLNSL